MQLQHSRTSRDGSHAHSQQRYYNYGNGEDNVIVGTADGVDMVVVVNAPIETQAT